MSDESFLDRMGGLLRVRNGEILAKWFSPTRRGETFRVCEYCGEKYEPHSRQQKFCSVECRNRNRKEKNEKKRVQ